MFVGGQSISYRPTSNPLSATDAGSSATVTIATFDMAVPGFSTVSVTGGTISGLAYSTLYFISYTGDIFINGGSVTFEYSTTKTDVLAGDVTAFYVGSILTPASGAPNTTGFNDGGAGAQNGLNALCYAGLYTAAVTAGGGLVLTNPGNMVGGNQTDYGTIEASGGNAGTIILNGISGVAPAYSSIVLNITTEVPAVTGGAVALGYSLNGGATWTNIYTVNPSPGFRALTTDQVTLAVTQPLGAVQIRVTASSGTLTLAECYLYAAWLAVTG